MSDFANAEILIQEIGYQVSVNINHPVIFRKKNIEGRRLKVRKNIIPIMEWMNGGVKSFDT